MGSLPTASATFSWSTTVERGFSVNKEVTIENLSEQSLVAQRTIVDHVRSVGGVLNVN